MTDVAPEFGSAQRQSVETAAPAAVAHRARSIAKSLFRGPRPFDLTRPVDAAWLAAFRVCFGGVMAISMARFLAYGWVDDFFVEPRFHFKYWGFGWVEALPRLGMHAVFWGLLASALAMALGLWFRVSAFAFAVGFGYVQLIDVTNYLNHYYLAWLLSCLLCVSPAGNYWSLDARRAAAKDQRREPHDPVARVTSARVAAGWLFVFRLQVGVVYTYAGLAKAHSDWLLEAQPLRIWLGAQTHLPMLGRVFTWDGVPLLMSWCGFLFDSTVVLFLLWNRTRWLAYTCVVVFHTMTRSLFPIGMFSSIMVLAALVFFPPDWPRRLGDRAARMVRAFRGKPNASQEAEPSEHSAVATPLVGVEMPFRFTSRGRLWAAAGAVFCTWQVLMPLRFLAYDGNVRWHEQGMRFSWRVMVREKNGSVTFHVRDPHTGRQLTVAPRVYLSRLQEREMSGQPDLILQLAHRIRDDYAAQFGGSVEVRAEALVSLNGRKARPLIDPSVDLARVKDGVSPYEWVLPAPNDPPPRVRPV